MDEEPIAAESASPRATDEESSGEVVMFPQGGSPQEQSPRLETTQCSFRDNLEAMEAEEMLRYGGFLTKRGSKRKNWKRRWFSLSFENGVLKLYYRANRDDAQHINFIVIDAATGISETSSVVPSRQVERRAFELLNPSRSHPLVAESEAEKGIWLVVLRRLKKWMLRKRAESEPGVLPMALQDNGGLSKATKLLQAGGVSGKKKLRVRQSMDLIVDCARGLSNWAGRELQLRVAYMCPTTSSFIWWEFSESNGAVVTPDGTVTWQADYSYERSLVGATLILRIVDVKTKEIVAEASRVDPQAVVHFPKDASHATVQLTLPLGLPEWSKDDPLHGGGVLSGADQAELAKQDKSELVPRGGEVSLQVNLARDAREGMLARMGDLAQCLGIRVDTGDVLLFSERSGAAKVTKLFTWSRWSHAAMVIRRPDHRLEVLEATGSGVAVYDLETVWMRYHRKADVAVAKLHVPNGLTDDDAAKLDAFVELVKGRPYEKNILFLVGRLAGSSSGKTSPRPSQDMSHLFCSELVAGAYRAMGLLDDSHSMESTLPKHFDVSESNVLNTSLLRDAFLFAPRIFSKNPVAEF